MGTYGDPGVDFRDFERLLSTGLALDEPETDDMQSDADDLEDQQDVLNSFLCPINLSVMRDPVVAADGFSYEREAIARWLQSNRTSPSTNLQMRSAALLPNRALKQAIEEYRTRSRGAQTSLGQRAGPSQEGRHDEDRPDVALEDLPESGVFVYLVTSRACVRPGPDFGSHHSVAEAGTFVVADRREYGASRCIFARLEDGNYVAEKDDGNGVLQRIEVNTALRVYRVIRPMVLRSCPSCSASAMVDGAMVHKDEMVSSTLSFVDSTRQVTYLRPEGGRYWLFTETLSGETCMAPVALECRGARAPPLIYELREDLKLRKWPHSNRSCEPVVEILKGMFTKAEARVRDPNGHWYVRVKEGEIHGWLPVRSMMKEWTSPPKPLCEGPPGNRMQVCLGINNDSWVVALDLETPDGIDQMLHWNNVPTGLARQLRKISDSGRVLRRVSFSQYSEKAWYLSASESDGSRQYWQCSQDDALDVFRERAGGNCVVAFGDEMRDGCKFLIARATGAASWEGLPDDMQEALLESTSTIISALVTADADWVVLYRGGACDYRLDAHDQLRGQLDRNQSDRLCSVALSDGVRNWIAIREHSFCAGSGLSERLKAHISDFYSMNGKLRLERRYRIRAYWEALLG